MVGMKVQACAGTRWRNKVDKQTNLRKLRHARFRHRALGVQSSMLHDPLSLLQARLELSMAPLEKVNNEKIMPS